MGDNEVLVHNMCAMADSVNQMNRAIMKGLAPKGIERVDGVNTSGNVTQPHVHFGDMYQTLNKDGTWGHEGGKIIPHLTKKMIEWLRSFGWDI